MAGPDRPDTQTPEEFLSHHSRAMLARFRRYICEGTHPTEGGEARVGELLKQIILRSRDPRARLVEACYDYLTYEECPDLSLDDDAFLRVAESYHDQAVECFETLRE